MIEDHIAKLRSAGLTEDQLNLVRQEMFDYALSAIIDSEIQKEVDEWAHQQGEPLQEGESEDVYNPDE